MRRLRALLVVAALALSSPPLFAQGERPLVVTRDEANGNRAVLRLGRVLGDNELADAIRSGLPLRIRFRVELWKDGFVDDLKGTEEWTNVLTFDPLSELYILRTRGRTGRAYAEYQHARAAVETAYAVSLRPSGGGRFYYTASVTIETLSLSDLDELERWLKGELQPAVSGDRSIPGALGQGARRLFMRVLSLPERRWEARSDRFRQ